MDPGGGYCPGNAGSRLPRSEASHGIGKVHTWPSLVGPKLQVGAEIRLRVNNCYRGCCLACSQWVGFLAS